MQLNYVQFELNILTCFIDDRNPYFNSRENLESNIFTIFYIRENVFIFIF